MSKTIKFALNEKVYEVTPPLHQTLLEFLRESKGLVGTKEGCNEGDCGACTVVAYQNGEFLAINACIRLLLTCDSINLFTIEYLNKSGALHPLQQAFIDHHASQCGFCTPGFIMSLYCLWLNENNPDLVRINESIAGNLCRCTGYYPIQQAALSIMNLPRTRPKITEFEPKTLDLEGFYAPITLDELATRYQTHPESLIVAGQTDIGLWINKHNARPSSLISLHKIKALHEITKSETEINIGAMVSNSQIKKLFETLHPAMYELMRRFGGEQIRNSGTIGGNIGNGSPIGDLPPLLIALKARLHLRCGKETRIIDLENYFIDYKKQDRKSGEFIEKVILPKLDPKAHLHISKISKRFDEDISTLLAVFYLKLEQGLISEARLAFGGMAAIPKRAFLTESLLHGRALTENLIEEAKLALTQDFTPLLDHRASSQYRLTVAQNLLTRFYEEIK